MKLCETIKQFEEVCIDRHDEVMSNGKYRADQSFWDGAAYAARKCQRILNGDQVKMAEWSDMKTGGTDR